MMCRVLILFLTVQLIWATPVDAANFPIIRPAIVNGEEAKLGEFPYQAIVYANFGSGWNFCSGSIISAYTILTAAHCVFKQGLVSNFLINL